MATFSRGSNCLFSIDTYIYRGMNIFCVRTQIILILVLVFRAGLFAHVKQVPKDMYRHVFCVRNSLYVTNIFFIMILFFQRYGAHDIGVQKVSSNCNVVTLISFLFSLYSQSIICAYCVRTVCRNFL